MHTACRVKSTCSAVLCRGRGEGVPQSCFGQGGTPVLSWLGRGVPQSCLDQGYLSPVLAGGYPSPVLEGIPVLGYPLARTGALPGKDLGPETWERTWNCGYPSKGPMTRDVGKNLGLGYPPGVNRHTPVKTLPSPSSGCGWQNEVGRSTTVPFVLDPYEKW